VAVSKQVAFKNPKAPVFPRLAQGKTHDEMTVTWTSGYDISEAYPFVEWGVVTSGIGKSPTRTPAGTLTFNRGSMCGMYGATGSSIKPFLPKTSSIRERERLTWLSSFRRASADGWVERPRLHPHGVHEGTMAEQRVSKQMQSCRKILITKTIMDSSP
jgi:hypothetical protein